MSVNTRKLLKKWFDRILSVGNRCLVLLDASALAALPALALALRLGLPNRWLDRWPNLGWTLGFYVAASLLVRLPIFYCLGLYRRSWRYASVGDLAQVDEIRSQLDELMAWHRLYSLVMWVGKRPLQAVTSPRASERP